MARQSRTLGRPLASTTVTVVPASGVTLYRQLASMWRAKIVAGEWHVGQQLPTVTQLAAQEGLAGVTVRHALRLLAQEGLVTSARGRGTFVCARPAPPPAALRAAINDPQLDQRHFRIELIHRKRGVQPPPELLGTGCAAESYVLLEKRHLLNGQPFCTMALYVEEGIFRRFPARSELQRKINGLLLEHAAERLRNFQTSITVSTADAQTALRLDCAFGDATARIVRRVLDADGSVVYAGLFWYRGDRFVLDIDMPASTMSGRPDWMAPDAGRS